MKHTPTPWITPEQLHQWYLEACQKIDPINYNSKAQKSYEELTEQQKFLDWYIANRINDRVAELEKALGVADRWFEKLINDADFTPLAINDPLKPLLEEAHNIIKLAIERKAGE